MAGLGILAALVLVAAVTLPPAFAVEQNGVIEMPFIENPPSIDGKWTSVNEWKDSTQTIMREGDNLAYLHVMHDRDNIYLIIDYVTDQNDGDGVKGAVVCFDTDDDGDNFFDTNDYCFIVVRTKPIGTHNAVGTIDEKGTLSYMQKSVHRGDATFSSANSPNEGGRDHNIYEMSIPISFLHKANSYGFFAEVVNGIKSYGVDESDTGITRGATWPPNLGYTVKGKILNSPSTWGTLKAPQGTVTSPPVPFISISTKSLSFGNEEVSDKSTRSVTITNTGTGLLKITNIRGTGDFSASGITTPAEVPAGGSVTFDAAFAPLTLGEKTGTITISSNDLSNPTINIQVSGKGVEKGTSPIPTSGGGCLIATAAFGTELAPQVQLLREVRDNAVFGTGSGTTFMSAFNDIYYSFSPTVADWERQNPVFKEAVKMVITPMLSTLSILNYAEIDSEREMLGYGIGIILLNLGMYFVAPALVVLRIRRIIL